MRKYYYIILLISITINSSCSLKKSKERNKYIYSPEKYLEKKNWKDYLDINATCDSTYWLKSTLFDDFAIISAGDGILFMTPGLDSITGYFKFKNIHNRNQTVLSLNNSKTKLLVATFNGGYDDILFQVDLKSHIPDWLIYRKNRSAYTDIKYALNDEKIIVSTNYDMPINGGRTVRERISTLFLINAKKGEFIDYYDIKGDVTQLEVCDNKSFMFLNGQICKYSYNDMINPIKTIRNPNDKLIEKYFVLKTGETLIADCEKLILLNGNLINKTLQEHTCYGLLDNRDFLYNESKNQLIYKDEKKLFFYDQKFKLIKQVNLTNDYVLLTHSKYFNKNVAVSKNSDLPIQIMDIEDGKIIKTIRPDEIVKMIKRFNNSKQ